MHHQQRVATSSRDVVAAWQAWWRAVVRIVKKIAKSWQRNSENHGEERRKNSNERHGISEKEICGKRQQQHSSDGMAASAWRTRRGGVAWQQQWRRIISAATASASISVYRRLSAANGMARISVSAPSWQHRIKLAAASAAMEMKARNYSNAALWQAGSSKAPCGAGAYGDWHVQHQ